MVAPAFANSWRLLPLHVQRPGRIVTPDLLLTHAWLVAGDGGAQPLAMQRLLLQPAIQLEPGEWVMAPALAQIRALDSYLAPAVALLRGERPEWLFLARQAFAAADLDSPVSVLIDGCSHELAPADTPRLPGVVAGIRLGAAEPLGGRTQARLSARSGQTLLNETAVALERLA